MTRKVAVIDTGTNSTRLLIAAVEAGRVRELERRLIVTRLGAGVQESGRLDGEARRRVALCMEGYAEIISHHQPDRTMILATSSVRDAVDGEEFIAGLAASHGFEYRVLGGDEEARLSFAGATLNVAGGQRTMFFDIGGGSTEIAVGKPGHPELWRSLDIGCVRLTERFLPTDPPTGRELADASEFVDRMLAAQLYRKQLGRPDEVIAVAGTMTALAAIDLDLEEYDRDRVDGHLLTLAAVRRCLQRLSSLPLARREEEATLEAGRADVIVAGALIAVRLMEFLGIDAVRISESDILDGAAALLAAGGG